MSDLRTIMIEAAGAEPAATALAVAEADLSRGRRALRRHRLARFGAGSGLAVVAVAGALALTLPGGSPAPAPSASAPSSGVKLVAYTGEQPVGYTLDQVPEGWTVQQSDRYALVLAPEGSKPVPDGEGVSLENKISVSQEGAVPSGVTKDPVSVDGRPGVVAHMLGADSKPDGTLTLFVRQPSGHYLSIQVWSGIGWDNQQIARFAAGVHISKDSGVTVG